MMRLPFIPTKKKVITKSRVEQSSSHSDLGPRLVPLLNLAEAQRFKRDCPFCGRTFEFAIDDNPGSYVKEYDKYHDHIWNCDN